MRPSEILEKHRPEIRQIIQDNKAKNPRVFGSVIRGEDVEESDLDIIVDPSDELTYVDIDAIMVALEKRFSLKVDIATPNTLPIKFREKVINSAIPLWKN